MTESTRAELLAESGDGGRERLAAFFAARGEPAYRARPELDGPLLVELAERLLAMDDEAFSRAFRGSPVKRARRNGLLRNVCVGLGNQGGEDAVAVLIRALQDKAPLVRGHAAWGLGRIPESIEASAALRARMKVEDDAWVREEIARALEQELRADPQPGAPSAQPFVSV